MQHIKKYSVQSSRILRETPELNRTVVEPYIQGLSAGQVSWCVALPPAECSPIDRVDRVYNILDGTSEAENVLFRDTDPETGFVLTPDLQVRPLVLDRGTDLSAPCRKWDQKTMTSLYLLVLTQTREIRYLRDLRTSHLPLLRKIREEAQRAAESKYGVQPGELRMFIHYQPTYCA